jgi:hypothetical protein
MIEDRKLQLIIQEEQEHVAKLKDRGLNDLIKFEAPRQYMNLVMEE